MNKAILKITLIITAILSFFLSSQANAIFHDEYWEYYLKNKNTHEIKQIHLNWDTWNGFFNTIQNRKLKPEKIPQKNYFENWDLVGYYHDNRHTNFQCKWNDGTVILSNLDIDHFGDNRGNIFCQNILQNYQDLEIKDLIFLDYWKYIYDFIVFMGLSIILGSIFDFFVLLPVFYRFKYLGIKKPLNIIHTLWIICFLGEIFSVYAGFSRMQISGELFGSMSIDLLSVMISPLYIWGIVIFFTKFIKIKWNIIDKSFINQVIANIFIIGLGLCLFMVYSGMLYSTIANQIGIILFIVVFTLIIVHQKKINTHMEKNFYPTIMPPKE